MEEESHSEESSPSRRLLSEVEKAKDDLDDFFKSFEEEAVTPAFAHAQEHPAPVFDKRNGGSRQQQCSCSNDMDALIAQIERGKAELVALRTEKDAEIEELKSQVRQLKDNGLVAGLSSSCGIQPTDAKNLGDGTLEQLVATQKHARTLGEKCSQLRAELRALKARGQQCTTEGSPMPSQWRSQAAMQANPVFMKHSPQQGGKPLANSSAGLDEDNKVV